MLNKWLTVDIFSNRCVKFIVFFILFTTSVYCSCLDTYFFDTGQGNLIVLKKNKCALIIDCGSTKLVNGKAASPYASQFTGSGYKIGQLKIILQGVNNCKTIITHDHRDHDNLYDSLSKEISVIKDGGKINSWDKNINDTFSQLSGCLGDDVEIIPIRPDN